MKRLGNSAVCALALLACGDPDPAPGEDTSAFFSGGQATVFDETRMAFAQPLPALEGERENEFFLGNAIFNRSWVTAPASVVDFDGLGPLFNARNCSACHFKDGRGRPPETADEPLLSLLVRLSIAGTDAQGGPLPDPTYGGQLQGDAIRGVEPEAFVHIDYEELPGSFEDGEPYSLRRPSLRIEQLAYGPLAEGVMMSARTAPAVFGLGLLAAVPDATLEALADPDDRDGDGISGRVNHVWDLERAAIAIGRFGWKANQPTLAQQTTGAFHGDMGITSTSFPEQECSPAEQSCSAEPSGAAPGEPELAPRMLASVVHYMHTLAVPARRDIHAAKVRDGQQLFLESGCGSCHVGELATGDFPEFPELERQLIHPYTDLLLHDMGEALADGRPDFEASGSEWRTPPLWGIGLVQRVNRHSYFLHDGRARGVLEAVLWHGGEAASARDAVLGLSREEREALVAFLESL